MIEFVCMWEVKLESCAVTFLFISIKCTRISLYAAVLLMLSKRKVACTSAG